jgi:hypothetical protein
MNNALPFMMMFGGGMDNMFSGMFNFDTDEDDSEEEEVNE